jgi:radical SAM protein with 4Fe4S-binding SPASM domain
MIQTMQVAPIHDHQFAGVRREFVFKVDGNRAILYPIDYNSLHVNFLTPIEGLAVSLLDGQKPFSLVNSIFQTLFPNGSISLASILHGIDARVRENVSVASIGRDGLFELSDAPIPHAPSFDPRQFVISPADYAATMSDVKRKFRLETPIDIYLVTTHRCVTDCLYCYADRKKNVEMPLARWQELIAEMARLGIRLCSPDNGEPFARQDGIDIMECMLAHKMHFLLSTKAHLSRDTVTRLIEAGFAEKVNGVIDRHVQLSIDAVDENISRRLLKVNKPRNQKNIETFENFMHFGIMPVVKAVVTPHNYTQAKPIVDFYYAVGARSFTFVRYIRSFHRHTDDLFLAPEHYAALDEQVAEIRSRYPDITLNGDLLDPPSGMTKLTPEVKARKWSERIGCGGGWQSLGIGPDGKAFLCEQMAYEEPYFVGDALTQSIEEIWSDPRLLRFIHPTREQFQGTPCNACDNFETCIWEKGRCYRDAYYSYGTIYSPPPLCPKNDRPGIRLN